MPVMPHTCHVEQAETKGQNNNFLFFFLLLKTFEVYILLYHVLNLLLLLCTPVPGVHVPPALVYLDYKFVLQVYPPAQKKTLSVWPHM